MMINGGTFKGVSCVRDGCGDRNKGGAIFGMSLGLCTAVKPFALLLKRISVKGATSVVYS